MGQIGVINYYVNTKSCLFECYYGVWRKVLLQLEPEGFCGLCTRIMAALAASFRNFLHINCNVIASAI
jgi:hypothetical protein